MKRIKISIILPCFKRMDYLNYTLWSLYQQKISYDLETIVLNDYLSNSKAEEICNKYQDKLNIKYIFTGQRNRRKKIIQRDQGFVLNIGVKQSDGDIIILTGNGLFHLNNTIDSVVKPLIIDKKILSTEKYIFFDNGTIVNHLSKNLTQTLPKNLFSIPISKYWGLIEYAYTLPFFMGMYKKEFIDIGGHDEDFIGMAGLDDDLIHRLKVNGLKFHYCNAKIVHLYHSKSIPIGINRWNSSKWIYNTFLRFTRQDIIVRNTDKEWGIIE